MATATLCDYCNYIIGSRSADHTNYGNKSLDIEPNDIKSLTIVVSTRASGDVCEICLKKGILRALGVSHEEIKRVLPNVFEQGTKFVEPTS